MARQVAISGFDNVLRNLNKEVMSIKGRSRAGMHEVALTIKNTALPLTPHDTGNLRGSWFSNVIQQGDNIGVEVGFGEGATYAVFVHERTELHHDPPTQSKFLEEALKRNEKKILQILRETAKT